MLLSVCSASKAPIGLKRESPEGNKLCVTFVRDLVSQMVEKMILHSLKERVQKCL